jgi:hypothetical protein
MTHFFSTSAGFWEKVAIIILSLSGPLQPKPRGRFLLLDLAAQCAPKRMRAEGGPQSGALIGEVGSLVNKHEFCGIKISRLKTMLYRCGIIKPHFLCASPSRIGYIRCLPLGAFADRLRSMNAKCIGQKWRGFANVNKT